jgi:predicted DNA-binding ribbon-helix-helix protein
MSGATRERRRVQQRGKTVEGGNMCHLFASQCPDSYAFETRSIRLNGQSTSLRLEKVFWGILEEIAAGEGMSAPRFISTLHREILLLRGEVPNFASHLRCICVMARTSAEPGGRPRAEAA